jgi:hypothetical protein
MKKIIFGVLILAAGVSLGWFLRKPATTPGNPAPVVKNLSFGAQISMASGAVEYKPADGKWTRAELNTVLQEGDSVEVRGEGKAIISIDDGSAIRIGNNSSVTLQKLSNEIRITNEKGTVYTRVVKADRPFIVLARSVEYQSLGTAFETINTEENQGVKVYESKVKIVATGEKEVLVATGEKYYVVNKENKKIEKTISKLEAAELKEKFTEWNKEEDLKNPEFADEMGVLIAAKEKEKTEEKVESTTETAAGITLTAVKTSEGVKLSWTVKDLDTSSGFKLVKGTAANPVFPGNEYQYLSNPSTRSYLWRVDPAITYYFRVCQYSDNGCKAYSNNVKITASETAQKEPSNGVALSAKASGNTLSWTATGEFEHGFKVVWSKQSYPTFPLRESDRYEYVSDPNGRSAQMTAFDGPGLYYARVCQYIYSVGCGTYSNQVQVNLE